MLFLLEWGQYPYVGSYYLRYVPVALMAVTTFVVFKAARDRPWFERPGWGKGVLVALLAAGALVLAAINWMAFRAHAVDVATVDMEFPLRGGTWYISTGGSNAVLNLHHKPHTPAALRDRHRPARRPRQICSWTDPRSRGGLRDLRGHDP